MNNKKGFAIQFNWIFILIVGALIMIFFFTIINKQRDISQESLNKEMLDYFDNIISGTNVKMGTVENTSLAGFSLDVSPDYIKIQGSTWEGIAFRNRIVFSPDLIKGDKLITYSDYWSMPYKIDYFIYLTSNEVRYIIIDDVTTAEDSVYINQLLNLLPKFTTKEVLGHTSISTMQDKNNYKIRFVFINMDPSSLISFGNIKERDFSAVNIITDDTDLDSYGTVKFYRKQNNQLVLDGESYYLGKETLLGAIYAENHGYYNKSITKALKKLDIISTIYKDNTILLKQHCETDLNLLNCIGTFENLLDEIEIILDNDEITESSFSSVYSSSEDISGLNKELILNSCPILY